MTGIWTLKRFVAIFAIVVFCVLSGMRPARADDAGKGWEYCYTNFPGVIGHIAGQPTYFTRLFAFQNNSAYGNLFSEYVEKKYSLRSAGPAGCSYGGMQVGVETSLLQRVEQLKAAGHPILQTEWTKDNHASLMAELARNPPPPPPAAPVTKKSPPPPSAGQSAYEKALEAQRPASVSASALHDAQAEKPGAPVPATQSQKYTYCVTLGVPRGNDSARESYYYTGIFATSPKLFAQRDFHNMLQASHPQEYIGSVACMTAQPIGSIETAMSRDAAAKRAKYNVVETNWKPKP